MDVTKDTLLHKADALLARARRARKLSAVSPLDVDREGLVRQAEELEGQAARLEKEAASAKNGVFASFAGGIGRKKPL